ncbi:PepSY-like domain-containing protein [Hymenobacter elongatus]|uniref:Uncharacterized protein n=1 Tax=Hymenobacter elongatus TaxID=877208 RepID=A0A4Z0PGG8_9BACT|nr:hypothetical protein [Hymenobacter elongatus]TGE14226.1 hypothetical protein E5J99_17060 [Hymenobacter elongatus]
MKKTVLLALLATLPCAAQARQLTAKQVPAAAVAAFRKAYPQSTTVAWEKEDHSFEVGFAQNKAKMSAIISAIGTVLETETAVPMAQLLAPVQARLASQYKEYTVTETARIVTVATGATVYEAEVTKGGKHRDVLFGADGREVK